MTAPQPTVAETPLTCDGGCESHEGIVRRVNVKFGRKGNLHNWGYFNYCDTAIFEDRSRGLTVTEDAALSGSAQSGG